MIPPWRRRLIFWSFLAAGCGWAALARAQELGPGVSGTLPEDYLPQLQPLIDRALRESPDLVASEISVEIAEASKLANGVSHLLPSLGGSVQYGEIRSAVAANSTANPPIHGFTYDLNGSQPVYQWGALKNGLALQKVAVAISEKNFAEAYRVLVGNLRREYLALVSEKVGLRNQRVVLKLRQDALQIATEQLKAGALSSGAIAGPQLEEEQAELLVDQAAQNYAAARRALARQLGEKDLPEAVIAEDVPAPRFSPELAQQLLADILGDGANHIASIELAALAVRNFDLQYRINAVNLFPKLAVRFDVSQLPQSTVNGKQVSQTFLTQEQYSLVANWNIFDGFATRGQKRIAFDQKLVAQHQLVLATDGLREAAQNAERNLELAWRQVAITERWARISEGEFAQTEDGVKHGNLSPSALDSARYGMYQSELNLIGRRSDFLSAWSDFVSLVGRDPAMNKLPARYVRHD